MKRIALDSTVSLLNYDSQNEKAINMYTTSGPGLFPCPTQKWASGACPSYVKLGIRKV